MDVVAIISVVASSTVAILATVLQFYQGHLARQGDRERWLRDKQAVAYVQLLKAFWWEPTKEKKGLQEWQSMWANVNAFGSDEVRTLFAEFYESDSESVRVRIEAQIARELQPKSH